MQGLRFIFCRVLTSISYIEVFWLLDYVCYMYNKQFIILRFIVKCILRFCSIHFPLTLGGLKNIVCYVEDFVK